MTRVVCDARATFVIDANSWEEAAAIWDKVLDAAEEISGVMLDGAQLTIEADIPGAVQQVRP